MEPLLRITSHPIRYELKTTAPSVSYNYDKVPKFSTEYKPSDLSIHRTQTTLKLDSTAAWEGLGFRTSMERSAEYAKKGTSSLREFVSETHSVADQAGNLAAGTKISDIYRNKGIEISQSTTVFLPTGSHMPVDMQWEGGDIDMEYKKGSAETKWEDTGFSMDYTPGEVNMEILEKNYVEIQYVGGYLYVPPSADPNYDG